MKEYESKGKIYLSALSGTDEKLEKWEQFYKYMGILTIALAAHIKALDIMVVKFSKWHGIFMKNTFNMEQLFSKNVLPQTLLSSSEDVYSIHWILKVTCTYSWENRWYEASISLLTHQWTV